MSAGKMLLGIFAGAAAGAALGILFAPDKGTETRRKIAEKSDEYAGQVKDKFNGIVDNLSKKMDDIQSKANDVANRAKSNVEEYETHFQLNWYIPIRNLIMEYKENLIESLIEKGEQYGKTTLELITLKTIDKSADIASTLVSWIIVIVLIVLFFLIINIGLALWIGELLGKSYYGFFVVAGFYALLSIIFGIFRVKLIKKPVNNSIITQVLD